MLSKGLAAALVGGNYAVGAMLMQTEAYADLPGSEAAVIRMVRQTLLKDGTNSRDPSPATSAGERTG